eukprot:365063-Chlamydomonas_euryale.AAC.13
MCSGLAAGYWVASPHARRHPDICMYPRLSHWQHACKRTCIRRRRAFSSFPSDASPSCSEFFFCMHATIVPPPPSGRLIQLLQLHRTIPGLTLCVLRGPRPALAAEALAAAALAAVALAAVALAAAALAAVALAAVALAAVALAAVAHANVAHAVVARAVVAHAVVARAAVAHAVVALAEHIANPTRRCLRTGEQCEPGGHTHAHGCHTQAPANNASSQPACPPALHTGVSFTFTGVHTKPARRRRGHLIYPPIRAAQS